ncbi:MAG: SH3 domain-containing protein [Deltaproteobacteria bacterium]|nr:SH3 domain-containing protein [Deltaproteobacteria bacterium]
MNTDNTASNNSQPNGTADTTDANPPAKAGVAATIIVVVLGILAFAIGFLLVHFTVPKPTVKSNVANCAPQTNAVQSEAVAMSDVETEGNDESRSDAASAEDETMSPDASGGLPEVPPGATPDGIRLDGAPLYFKCWVKSSDSGSSKECDRLRVLEKRMVTRLYVVDECRQQHAGEKDLGLLSLGANLDFSDNTISFWSGPSSTIANAQKIGNCVRQKLAGLPLSSISHKHEKYRIFFSVDFFDVEERQQMLERKRKNGREVTVSMDNVNVREEPVDGASLGRISSDSKVIFLKKNDTKEWCQVLTPSNRIGWMICDALKL